MRKRQRLGHDSQRRVRVTFKFTPAHVRARAPTIQRTHAHMRMQARLHRYRQSCAHFLSRASRVVAY